MRHIASMVRAHQGDASELMNFIISLAEVDFLVAMCKYGDLDMDMSLSRELWPVHSPLCLPRSLLLFYILKSEYSYPPRSHRAWIDFKQAGSFFLILRTQLVDHLALCTQTVWKWWSWPGPRHHNSTARVTMCASCHRGASFLVCASIKFPIKLNSGWIGSHAFFTLLVSIIAIRRSHCLAYMLKL